MEYIEKVLNNFEENMESTIFEDEDIHKLFETDDVVVELVMEGFINIYKAYSESHNGAISFCLENNYLIEAHIIEDEL